MNKKPRTLVQPTLTVFGNEHGSQVAKAPSFVLTNRSGSTSGSIDAALVLTSLCRQQKLYKPDAPKKRMQMNHFNYNSLGGLEGPSQAIPKQKGGVLPSN
jgi:hypothetical protein